MPDAPELPTAQTLLKYESQKGLWASRAVARRGYSAHGVLLLCVASFVAGRYLDLLADFDSLPDPSKGGTKEVTGSHPSHDSGIIAEGGPESGFSQDSLLEVKQGVSAPCLNFTGKQIQQNDIDRIGRERLLADLPPLEPAASGSGEYRTIPFQVLSWYPRIVLFPKFLDHDKCDHVIDLGRARLGISGLVLRKGETTSSTADIRTSSGTFLSSSQDPQGVLSEVDQRISAWTNIPVGHFEPFNLLRYELGQHYDSHYDAFDESYGPQPSQRMATFLTYLSTPEEGGETVFPLEGRDGLARLQGIDYKRCDMGFKYKPRKGDGILFWSLHPNGTMDKHSLHGGCPVVKGEKWVITKWIRDKCFARC